MKTLSRLIKEAEERFNNELGGSFQVETGDFSIDHLRDFIRKELETIVKESFKNTRVEEENKTNARALSMEWLIDGYNTALSDKHNKENQFLNN